MTDRVVRGLFWGGVIALGAALVASAISDWDLSTAQSFYDGEASEPWPVGEEKLCDLVERYGQLIGPLIGVVCAAVFAFSLRGDAARRRRLSLWLLLFILIGPGLLVHGTKTWWGRSRPRDVYHWKRPEPYRPWIAPAGIGRGASFPSGHVASAASLIVTAVVVFRRRTSLAIVGVLVGAAVTGIVAWGRVANGAHFVSDTIAATFLVVVTAGLLSDFLPSDSSSAKPVS